LHFGEVKIGKKLTRMFPDDPADTYFSIAFRRMKECGRGPTMCKSFYRQQDILTSCICSFLSLESSINRLFYDIFIQSDENKRPIKQGIPQSFIQYLKQSWRRASVRDKFILLPPLISDYEFDLTVIPFSLFDEFIRFRNQLVHPKISTTTYVINVEEGFEENSWAGEVISELTDALPTKQAFPLTNFTTSFKGLVVDDAEKAFEIAYRMRMKLHMKVFAPPPILVYEFADEIPQFKIGEGILDAIQLRFGPPPEKKDEKLRGD
jgi:hypothetical protein